MGYGKWITFLFHIFIHLIGFTIEQPEFINHWCINSNNYTSNSTYERNLEAVLTAVATNTNINYGFYNFSVGESPDNTANAIALCRGDYEVNLCRSCVNDATHKLRQVCPNQKEAHGWYDYCMLRYSNRSIFGSMETLPAFIGWRLQNYSDVDQFYALQRRLLGSLRDEAARGDSQRKFATGTVAAPNFETIYGLVQCTPDLYEYQCIECLQSCMDDLPYGYSGGGVSKPSCTLRHELYPFFNETVTYAPPPADAPPPPPLAPLPADAPPRPLSGKDLNTTQIVSIIIASIVICSILCFYIFIKKMNPRKSKEKYENMDETNSTVESLQFDFNTTRVATNNFSDSNKLGEGGFGVVYKGRLQNGQEIAVKRLSKNSRQGELEFKNEVLLMFKLQHRGLVRLLGFCLEGTERLLIYEFVPNASLDHFLFDVVKCAYLDWKKRYAIIEGVARGLLYLHEDSRLRIIHRDLKASNILLDADMNPKISDFGMARLFAPDESQHKTRRIVGTFGYMAPEYAKHGQFSVKSDVFSFGVLVLEIVSGKKNCFRNGENMEDLRSYAWRNWQKGRASKVIDPRLRVRGSGSGSIRNIMRCIHIGLLCVQENAADRPTMASVVLMLNSFSFTLPLPYAPAFYVPSSIGPEIPIVRVTNSGPNESNQSINEVSITELYPR